MTSNSWRPCWRTRRSAQGLIAKHPEFQSLVGKLMSLYSEITTKGLENEQKKG